MASGSHRKSCKDKAGMGREKKKSQASRGTHVQSKQHHTAARDGAHKPRTPRHCRGKGCSREGHNPRGGGGPRVTLASKGAATRPARETGIPLAATRRRRQARPTPARAASKQQQGAQTRPTRMFPHPQPRHPRQGTRYNGQAQLPTTYTSSLGLPPALGARLESRHALPPYTTTKSQNTPHYRSRSCTTRAAAAGQGAPLSGGCRGHAGPSCTAHRGAPTSPQTPTPTSAACQRWAATAR